MTVGQDESSRELFEHQAAGNVIDAKSTEPDLEPQ
jgi:hypothetical protein